MKNLPEIVKRFTYLLNYQQTAISWHLEKQVGVIAYPIYEYKRLRRFPASEEKNVEIKNKKIILYHSPPENNGIHNFLLIVLNTR